MNNKEYYPLFDIHTDNIYYIESNNLTFYINEEDYRLPDQNILEYLSQKIKLIKHDNSNNHLITTYDKIKNMNLNKLKSDFEKVYFNNLKNTCIRPDYSKLYDYISPYFININSNKLCEDEKLNTIPFETLYLHQKYLIENNGVGILQYYSLLGSYNFNMYLREINSIYKDKILENMIISFVKIIKKSPKFNLNYKLYRNLHNDDFLQNLNIGDIFLDNGFMSTTRKKDFNSEYYKLGDYQMIINIPKNTKGIGICIELFSYFKTEQEVILAPFTKLKFIKKIENKYYFDLIDTNIDFIINNINKIFSNKKEPSKPKILSLNNNFDEQVNELGQFKIEINNEEFLFYGKKTKVNNPYNLKWYFVQSNTNMENLTEEEIEKEIMDFKEKQTEEFIIYSIIDNNIILFLEFNEDFSKKTSNVKNMFVNNNAFYNYLYETIEDYVNIEELIKFLIKIAKYFMVEIILLSGNFVICDKKVNNEYYGFNYNQDLYKFLKYNILKSEYFEKIMEKYNIYETFDKKYMQKYFKIDCETILNKPTKENYEVYQIYKFYKTNINKNISIADFYIWLVENKCFMANKFNQLITKSISFKNNERDMFNNSFYSILID